MGDWTEVLEAHNGPSVKVGIFLTNQHPLHSNLVEGQSQQLELFRRARDWGWDSVFAGQHFLAEGMAMLQPVPFLARIASESHHMTVGTGVILLTLANPLYTAELAASMDITTGGRFVLGVGLGYREVESQAFGVGGRRVERFTTNLEIVKSLLSGEVVNVDVPWCHLKDARLTAPPVQRPRPPIWLAANADRAVERAARLADTWLINPHATVSTVGRQLGLFDKERSDAGMGRPNVLPLIREIHCSKSSDQAWSEASIHLENKYRTYTNWGQDEALPDDDGFQEELKSLATDRFIVGDPDECLRELMAWRTIFGVNHFILRTHWSGMPYELSINSMRLLSQEVIPALKREDVISVF